MAKRSGIKAVEYIHKNCKRIVKEANLAAQIKIVKDIDYICRTSIDAYYEAFTPNFYKRTESLYKAYRVKIDRNDVVIKLGGEFIPDTHRVSTDYIYNMMFKEGWHGGAPRPDFDDGNLYWRSPAKKNDGMPPFTFWGQIAPRTEAPFVMIEKRVNNYAERNIEHILINSFQTTLNKYL